MGAQISIFFLRLPYEPVNFRLLQTEGKVWRTTTETRERAARYIASRVWPPLRRTRRMTGKYTTTILILSRVQSNRWSFHEDLVLNQRQPKPFDQFSASDSKISEVSLVNSDIRASTPRPSPTNWTFCLLLSKTSTRIRTRGM